jgi:hypothetical protein
MIENKFNHVSQARRREPPALLTLAHVHTPKTKNTNMKVPLHAYTCLGFLVNDVIGANPQTDLSYREIFDAACDGRLIPLLVERYSHLANWTLVTEAHAARLEQMEAALRDAASAYEGRMGGQTGHLSGLHLVMDIILETLQQQFHPPFGFFVGRRRGAGERVSGPATNKKKTTNQ